MRYFISKSGILAFIFIVLFASLALPRLISLAFPPFPDSPDFDCDDCALAMYQHFQSLGIESTPIVGNLKMAGETYMQSNHVWLLVKFGNSEIAYDWGTPRFDRQHYEGYIISLDTLLSAVAQDKQASGNLSSPDQ